MYLLIVEAAGLSQTECKRWSHLSGSSIISGPVFIRLHVEFLVLSTHTYLKMDTDKTLTNLVKYKKKHIKWGFIQVPPESGMDRQVSLLK